MTTFPIAILAGGLATRLGPLTAQVPKSLVPIAGRPFIVHQLELLRCQGTQRAILCVGHLGEQIQALVGNGSRYGVAVEYSLDGDQLLGTGGALRNALPLLGEHFMVLNGDSYVPCSFAHVRSAYVASGYPALMTIVRNDNRWDRSNVLMQGARLAKYDKTAPDPAMTHIDFGLTVLSSAVFARYPQTILDLADVYRDLAQEGRLAALEVTERFYEIGSREGIVDTEQFLSRQPRSA